MPHPQPVDRRRRRAPRGYLLAEACVAGAVLATSIAITFTLMAQGRTEVTYAAHRKTAAMLGRTKADELASAANCAGATSGGVVVVGPPFDQFQWKFDSGNATILANSTPAIPNGNLCQATVEVHYPAQDNSQEDMTDGVADHSGVIKFTRYWAP